MKKSKNYSDVYDFKSRRWNCDEMERLGVNDWRDWVKDRLHKSDGLCEPDVRVEEEREDVFLWVIPKLIDHGHNKAIQGVILAYQDSIENYNSDKKGWSPDALGALILLVRLLIVQGSDIDLADKINEMTVTLLKIISEPILVDNKARDPYTQASYLLKNHTNYKEENKNYYVDSWLSTRKECHVS